MVSPGLAEAYSPLFPIEMVKRRWTELTELTSCIHRCNWLMLSRRRNSLVDRREQAEWTRHHLQNLVRELR